MKNILLTILTIISFSLSSQDFRWVNTLGSQLSDKGNSVTHDTLGNLYITGTFSGTVDFDPGPAIRTLTSTGNSNIFIAKFDSIGNYVWAKKFGNGGVQFGSVIESSDAISIDASGIYLTGKFRGTVDFDPSSGGVLNLASGGLYHSMYILSLDFFGNFKWAKRIVGSATQIYPKSISTDNSGNIYLTGQYNYGAIFDIPSNFSLNGNELGTVFILKMRNTGDFKWAKSVDGHWSAVNTGIDVKSDKFGNVYTIGTYRNAADFDPSSGIVNIVSNNNSQDIFVQKLDSLGNFIWVKSFGSIFEDSGNSIAINDDNIYVSGSFQGTISFDSIVFQSTGMKDVFISKISPTGDVLWAKAIGGNKDDVAISTKVNKSGKIYTTGIYNETVDFNPGSFTDELTSTNGTTDVFLLAIDSLGHFEWVRGFGGTETDLPYSLSVGNTNTITIIGTFSDTVDFDPSTLISIKGSQGNEDVFVIQFDDNSSGLSTEENRLNSIHCYPNPSQGIFNLTNLPGIQFLEVLDSFGLRIMEKDFFDTDPVSIDLSNFPKGFYRINLHFTNSIFNLPIIIN